MSVKFEVKINEKHILDFLLYHGRTRMTGYIGVVLTILTLTLGIIDVANGNPAASLTWFAFAGILMIFPRTQLKKKAKRQAQADMFQNSLEYEFSKEGITARQGDVVVTNTWDSMNKVVSTKKCIFVYMSRVRAIIFPKEAMGDKYDEVVSMIRENMPAKKVRIR